MASKFRLRDSKYLAETYMDAVQALSALEHTDAEDGELVDSVSEIPTTMLVDLLACYIHMYDKLLEHELAIGCTKALINSDTLH